MKYKDLNFGCVFLAHPVVSLTDADQVIVAITDTKLYVPIVTLSTNDKLLQQLKSEFKRTINWNKYQSKATIQAQNWYLGYLIDPSFQGIKRISVFYLKTWRIE